ncbi:hypothetical protein M8007_00505 [Dinoroseobacter shibae]|jgi:hypothetical protein|nr:hypothetical protein [Dinoroseobacter shibae]URF46825.1 hypothetical protein M8008_00505 [Dinoroseobacter shibae]URF51136.1 hypothetical protein M8007_00505 [Dinoroseobacter shibae]
MSEQAQEFPYLFCIPMRAWEKDGLQPVLEIQCAYPLGVLDHGKRMLEALRAELASDHPVLKDFEALIRVAEQAHLQADALHRVIARGTFVRQPEGGADD